MGRRSYGTGSLFVHSDALGRETWYGRWRAGRRRLKRRIGPKRPAGSRQGLTRAQAERALQRMIETERPRPTRPDVSVEEAGQRLISHLEALGRKPTTLGTYRSLLRAHLAAHLGDEPLDRVGTEDVEALVAAMRRGGVGSKTIRNALALLHQILAFGQRNGWCVDNPCPRVDRPQLEENADIRFLDMEEVEALLRAVPSDDPLGPTDRALYLTAAMTGLRQGELLALRWRDIDWGGGTGARSPELRPRSLGNAEVEARLALDPAGRSRRR